MIKNNFFSKSSQVIYTNSFTPSSLRTFLVTCIPEEAYSHSPSSGSWFEALLMDAPPASKPLNFSRRNTIAPVA